MSVPRLLGGTISVRGYPLEMVPAEKIVTAIQRGTANTRWRDFADVYLLSAHHPIDAQALLAALSRVAEFRQVELVPLREVLGGIATSPRDAGRHGYGSSGSATAFHRTSARCY